MLIIRTTMKEQTIDAWIKNRKSTFINGFREGSKIADSIIEKLLDNAIWAPSHGLVQAWNFKVFTGKALDRFYKFQQEVYKEITPGSEFNAEKYQKMSAKSNKVSHVIAVIARRDPKKRFPKQEDIVSVACAIQNIYLCLEAYGVAGYLSTGDICYTHSMRKYLDLKDEDECLGFFTLGIADENYKRPERKRIPAREKTEWIRE